jgi:hypothetical protein
VKGTHQVQGLGLAGHTEWRLDRARPFRIYVIIWKPSAATANPNPNPATRFSSENQPEKSGRPQGLRDRLSKEFTRALSADFETHGETVIQEVRTEARQHISASWRACSGKRSRFAPPPKNA